MISQERETCGGSSPDWSRAYWAVALLALVLVPPGAYVGAAATATGAHVWTETGMKAALPPDTEFFIQVGPSGYALIAGTCLSLIGALAFARNRPAAVVLSMVLFAGCLGFFLLAALASHHPIQSVVY